MSKLAKHAMEPEKSSSCYIQTCWNDAVVLYMFSGLLLGKFQNSPWHIVLWPVHQPRSGRRGCRWGTNEESICKGLGSISAAKAEFCESKSYGKVSLAF